MCEDLKHCKAERMWKKNNLRIFTSEQALFKEGMGDEGMWALDGVGTGWDIAGIYRVGVCIGMGFGG